MTHIRKIRLHLKANLITWPGALKSFSEAFKSFSRSFKSLSGALKSGITLARPLSSHPYEEACLKGPEGVKACKALLSNPSLSFKGPYGDMHQGFVQGG